MTTPDEAREQAHRIVAGDPDAQDRVKRAVIRWRLRTHYPPVTRAQQDADFAATEAALEAEQERRRR